MMLTDVSRSTGWRVRLKAAFYRGRQNVVNTVFSLLYGQPMQVMPKGHVALAGAVVFWYVQDGQRMFVMVRQDGEDEGKVRFVSCMGTGRHGDMSSALKAVVKAQLGDVFARSAIGGKVLHADHVAAAPLFSYTDPHVGVPLPVQSLVWVVHVSHHVAELAVTPPGLQVMMVPEGSMGSAKVSATHRNLWQAVQRQLPKMKKADTVTPEAVEDAIRTLSAGPRIVH